jgi:hypothetical protein
MFGEVAGAVHILTGLGANLGGLPPGRKMPLQALQGCWALIFIPFPSIHFDL